MRGDSQSVTEHHSRNRHPGSQREGGQWEVPAHPVLCDPAHTPGRTEVHVSRGHPPPR